jgi:PAS domain S-box-containing protein
MLSLENLRTVFDTCPETCLVLYPDAPRFTIAYANPSYLCATNRTANDLIGKGIFEAFPDTHDDTQKTSDIKISLEQVLDLKSAHKSSLFRFNLNHSDSERDEPHFWVCETYPLINNFGSIEYIVRKPVDVTQFISEDVEKLNLSKFLVKDVDNRLFRDHPDAVFTLDLQGCFLSVNKQLVEIAECQEAELLKMSFLSFIAVEDLVLVSSHLEKALDGEIQHFDARVISAKGKRFILDITHLPIIINSEVVGIYTIAKDVTALRNAEQQLEAYNHRISNILESVTDGFLAVDRNFSVTYWNKEAERILCKPRHDAMGKNLWDLYPQAVEQKFYYEYHRALSKNISIQFQEYLKDVDCWLEVTAYPSEDGLSIFFRDVTERMKFAHDLSISEQRFKALVQEGSDLIHIIDKHGFYTYVSPNTHTVLEQVFAIGDKAFSSILEPDQQNTLDILFKLKKGECTKLPPIRCLDKNNEIQWMEVILTNLMDDSAVNGIVANCRNVTKQIDNELKIRESIEQYEIVSEATSDAIYEWDFKAKYLKWNKGFKVLFGHEPSSSDDVYRWFKMLHPEDRDAVKVRMQAIFKAMEPKLTLEYRLQCFDGSYKHVLDRGYINYDESGEPIRIIGAIQDVTDRINYIHRLEEKNKKLSEISWLQSHVVRAPLAQIMGLSELMSVEECNVQMKELISHLRNSANDLDQVIRDIISKTEDV